MTFSALEQQLDNGGGLSENIAEDIVEYLRGSVIANEAQGLLCTFQYATGWLHDPNRFVNSVLIGPAAGGKTQVQDAATDLLPSTLAYQATNASDNALIDDPEWDSSLVAPLDEYDKINAELREYMKSMAGEDGGYTKKRNVEDSDAEGGYSPATISSMPMPFQFLYAPTGKKGSIDHELQSRMLKLYIDDNRFIREAIGRKEFGHELIDVDGLTNTYVFETTNIERGLKRRFRQLPTERIQTDDDNVNPRLGGMFAEMGDWVWYSVRPVFDEGPTQTNRTFGMVSNLMRGSTVLNHPNREEVLVRRDGEDVDAQLVYPQDVANVLCCQPTLLSTTHNLNPLKRDVLDAVDATERASGETTIDRIYDWLGNNDKRQPGEQKLRSVLQELADDFLIKIREHAGDSGSHLYEWRDEGSVDPPRLFNLQQYADADDVDLSSCPGVERGIVDPDDPFADCWDPIRDQPFHETVETFDDQFSGSNQTPASRTSAVTTAADAMGGPADDEGDNDQQATLTGETPDEGDPEPERGVEGAFEQAVYDTVSDHCDGGEPFSDRHSIDHYLGIVDTDMDVQEADVLGSMMDPEHDVWDHPEIDDERVRTIEDARRELADVFDDLQQAGLVVVDEDSGVTGFYEVRVVEP